MRRTHRTLLGISRAWITQVGRAAQNAMSSAGVVPWAFTTAEQARRAADFLRDVDDAYYPLDLMLEWGVPKTAIDALDGWMENFGEKPRYKFCWEPVHLLAWVAAIVGNETLVRSLLGAGYLNGCHDECGCHTGLCGAVAAFGSPVLLREFYAHWPYAGSGVVRIGTRSFVLRCAIRRGNLRAVDFLVDNKGFTQTELMLLDAVEARQGAMLVHMLEGAGSGGDPWPVTSWFLARVYRMQRRTEQSGLLRWTSDRLRDAGRASSMELDPDLMENVVDCDDLDTLEWLLGDEFEEWFGKRHPWEPSAFARARKRSRVYAWAKERGMIPDVARRVRFVLPPRGDGWKRRKRDDTV